MADSRVRRVLPEDLSNVEFETSEEVEVVSTFDNMGLKQDLIRGIYAYGNYFYYIINSFHGNLVV